MNITLVQEGNYYNVYINSILHSFDTEAQAVEFLEAMLAKLRS